MGSDHTQTPPDAAPLVSVIIPVFDDVRGIGTALEAALDQTYPATRYEVLVVDNGSRDGTRDAVLGYARVHPDRIQLLEETSIRGSYAARNTGIAAARGDILAFTDADCVPEPHWLEAGVRALTDADAAYAAGAVEMTFEGDEPGLWEYYDAVGKLKQKEYLEQAGFGATANLFVRRSAIEAHGAFRGDLVSGGDYEFGRRLAKAGEVGVYAGAATVRHPARSSGREILRKERRILQGRQQLEALGLLDHGRLTWRSFVPVRRCPKRNDRAPGLIRRVGFVLIANFVRYYTLALRLGARIAGGTGGRGKTPGRS